MVIAELWRYPVKSMGGELLDQASLSENGIDGDRVVHVAGPKSRFLTSRTKPKLLAHKATLGPDGEPRVDGRAWTEQAVADDVRLAAGPGAQLRRFDGPERFDVLPLLVASDGAIDAFGYDRRRLRPNIVVGGVRGLEEREWEGKMLQVGEEGGVVIGMADLRTRCVMTTFDPDTQEQDMTVLRSIRRRFGGKLALNCRVLRGGVLRVGDPVKLIDP